MGPCWQVWAGPQTSLVQGSLSLQSLALMQQPAIVVCWHMPVATTHESCVQALLSTQSASLRQQLATGVCTQPVDGLHVSVVQTTPSSQLSAAPPVHAPAPLQ